MRSLILFLAVLFVLHGHTAVGQHILFLRGGPGTGGFLEGGADEQLSDIMDQSTAPGNHGWYELGRMLQTEGYQLEQMQEGPADENTPVPLAALDLSRYDVVVFGSNNASYTDADIDSVEAFVRDGGGALFISDANWGRNWGDAPSSDQQFLDRFGLVMNQDRGTYTLRRDMAHFVVDGQNRGTHPVLGGVNAFDGEGVSPITIARAVPGVTALVLARALQPLQENDTSTAGSVRNPTSADGALVVAEAGEGRIACHFDRNTFFNANGAGTDLHRFDNTQYARNLFAWLSDKQTTAVALLPRKSDNKALHMRVYPMPAKMQLSLRLLSARTRSLSVELRDVHGALRWSAGGVRLRAGRWQDVHLPVSELRPGVYFLSALSSASTAVRRIVIVR